MYFSTIGLTALEVSRTTVPSDGVQDAWDLLRHLLLTGKHLIMEPGKTYLVSRPLIMQPGQILFGNGATLKRAAQIPATTTITAITAFVTTTITVADASHFLVGMGITVSQGGVASELVHTIIAISGNQITVDTPFNVSYTGTTSVWQGYHLLKTVDDCRVFDLTLDGNRSNWVAGTTRFQQTADLALYGDRVVAERCRIVNSPGEACTLFTGDDVSVLGCFVNNANGNGIHLASCVHPVVSGCRVVGVNDDVTVGHADGCIISSNDVQDPTIVGNYCEDGICGVGSIDSAGNSHVTITDNTIRNCTGTGLDLVTGNNEATTNMVITGNRIYSSVKVSLQASVGATQFPARVLFANNLLEETYVQVYRSNNVVIHDNVLNGPTNVTNLAIEIHDCKDVVVHHNQINGFTYAVWTDGSRSENIAIDGNVCRGQQSRGIQANYAGGINVSVTRNVIMNAAGCAATYDGIVARDDCLVEGNQIKLAAAVAAHAGIYPKEGARVRANTILHGGATGSIIIDGGQTAATIVEDNYITMAVTDGTSGTATLAGNRVVT
jgi:parallel beta helix pectate lyase-like protein